MITNVEKNSLQAWIMAARIRTLSVPFSAVIAATFLVMQDGHNVDWILGFNTLWVAILITIATNFINDGVDFFKGKDTSRRLGFQRVSQSGLIAPELVYKSGIGLLLLAFIASIPLFIHGGWPIIVIIPICLLAGYAYTGGPYPISYNGLGELFVLAFYGWILTGGVYYLQTKSYNFSIFVLGFQMGLLATALIAINNFRDIAEDSLTQKKTLAVRFGSTFSRFEIIFCILAPFVVNLYWLRYHTPLIFVLPTLILPIALDLSFKINQEDPSTRFNKLFAQAAFLHLSFGLLLGLGFFFRS